MDLIDLTDFPDYYKKYSWNKKHKLFGYPEDKYPTFEWISSLEHRFSWLCSNYKKENTASKYLIQEMIEWGGSQNGVLQKFNDESGEANLYELICKVVENIDDAENAINSALEIPGFGLTYSSKLLRFMKPEKYGALDSRLREALIENIGKINDGKNKSMVVGYLKFLKLLEDFRNELKNSGVKKPECQLSKSQDWNAAQIEMALFCWAEQSNVLKRKRKSEENPTKKQTKMDRARIVYQKTKTKNCGRKDIIESFISEVGMSNGQASTYYQKIKNE